MTNSEWDEEDLGAFLRRLRGRVSLREVQQRTGVSYAYLSQIETGERKPGRNVISRLAPFYGVEPHVLLRKAGLLDDDDPLEAEEIERAYRFVLDDSRFKFGTRPRGPINLESKRFIVEIYESFTGKKLLG